MTVIHWYRPGRDESGHDRRYETRISTYDWGDARSIEALLVSQVKGQGHEVIPRGGDFTGKDGQPRGLYFDVIVTLEGHEPMTWEHAVCEPSENWLKPIKRATPRNPEDGHETSEVGA